MLLKQAEKSDDLVAMLPAFETFHFSTEKSDIRDFYENFFLKKVEGTMLNGEMKLELSN